MIPTTNDILTDTRILLEDPNGVRFDNPTLIPHLQVALSEVYSASLANDLPLIHRSVYPIISPYTGILYPSIAGIANMGEPTRIRERGFTASNSVSITAITVTSGIATVTIGGGHPFLDGQNVTHHGITGLSDDINDIFMIEKISGTQYRIRGVTSTGTYPSTPVGTATYSAEAFIELSGPVDPDAFTSTTAPSSSLSFWRWDRDRFRFPGATVSRQLEITFRLSDSLPVGLTVPIGIDGSLPFFKFRVAGLALTNIAPSTASGFNAEALGNTGKSVDLGGLLGSLLRPQIRTSQRIPIQRPPYRRKRSTGPHILQG